MNTRIQSGTEADIPVRGAKLVTSTARLLRALAEFNRTGCRINDLAQHTGIERGAVSRILRALCAEGIVARVEGSHRFALGPVAFELGLAATHRFPLREIALPSMERIAAATGDTCFLMVHSGQDAVCIDRHEGGYPIKTLTIDVGNRRPLGAAAASLALLMHMPREEREAYLEANAARIQRYGMLTADVVRGMIERALTLGFALNHNNILPEVSAVGVAIPSRLGRPYAAISVSALTSRIMNGERYRKIVELLTEESQVIAARL